MPNSKVIICKNIKIDRQYVNVLNYSESQMIDLCYQDGVCINYANDFSFIRTGEPIKVPFNYEECEKAEYIAFQNPSYSNKWFFAWIDEIKWINEHTTQISYTIDSFSTFFQNVNIKPCFVVREHVADDTIGLHRVPENLNVGDLICDGAIESPSGFALDDITNMCVGVACNYNPYDETESTDPVIYNKNVFATPIYFFSATTTEALKRDISVFIECCSESNHIDDIKEFFYFPQYLLGDYDLPAKPIVTDSGRTGKFFYFPESFSLMYSTELFTKRQTFSDFVPKNNKVKCYPYNFLQVSNNVGNIKNYKFEDFDSPVSGKVQFRLDCTISVGCSGRIYPMNYKGKLYELTEQIPLAKFPTINWASDSYTNWLTEQSNNSVARSIVSGKPSQILGSAIGKRFGETFSGIATDIVESIGGFDLNDLIPTDIEGRNTGDVNFLDGGNTFTAYRLRCRTENLKIIDSYFSRFGYKINETKTPNLSHRQNFNYVEIGSSECIGYGNGVPSKHMENINNAFRRGVTIWKNHSNLGNYSVSNNII